MFHDIQFAFVSFINGKIPYPQLFQITNESHRLFSKVPLILYTQGIEDVEDYFPARDGLYIIQIPESISLSSIYYYKPYVILDVLEKGLQAGYYIEADDILTPDCDRIQEYISRIETIPLSPIHPDGSTPPLPNEVLRYFGVNSETQPYCHAHVLFTKGCLSFIKEWMSNCNTFQGFHFDETVLNCLYWKHKCQGHYLPLIDPATIAIYNQKYLTPYTHILPTHFITYHGTKKVAEAAACLDLLSNVSYKRPLLERNHHKDCD